MRTKALLDCASPADITMPAWILQLQHMRPCCHRHHHPHARHHVFFCVPWSPTCTHNALRTASEQTVFQLCTTWDCATRSSHKIAACKYISYIVVSENLAPFGYPKSCRNGAIMGAKTNHEMQMHMQSSSPEVTSSPNLLQKNCGICHDAEDPVSFGSQPGVT